MILSSSTKKPSVHASAYIAPNAVISGDVTIEEGCAVLFGAVITSEGAPVVIGANSVVMENAVLKASGGAVLQFPLTVGESCIIGPGAFVVGATIEPGALIGAGARVTHGETVAQGAGGSPEFFEGVFNIPHSDDAGAKAAETYSKFLRKTHAQDAIIAEPTKKAPPKPVSKTVEPPPTQSADVGKVVDVMFAELEEARLRRESSIEKEKRGKR